MKMKDGGNKRRLSNEGKRAAHIKWDGKTISLGTFPDNEAAIMCKRAKALTKAWRSMSPKPTVDEVKLSLETSGIRVVNNRPGRQARKKDGGPNQKGPIQRERNVIPQQIQSRSLSSFVTIPPHPIAMATMNPRTDSFTHIAEAGSTSPESNVQPSSLMLMPVTPLGSLPHPYLEPPIVTPTNSVVQDQNETRFMRFDLEDLDIEKTYATLKKHHSNLESEIEEIKKLMRFYRDERSQRQLVQRERHGKQKRDSKSQIDQRIIMQTDPIPINQAKNRSKRVIQEANRPQKFLRRDYCRKQKGDSQGQLDQRIIMRMDPVPIKQAKNCPIQVLHDYLEVQPETNRPKEIPELCGQMDDSKDDDSVTNTIELMEMLETFG